ncbi:MAG TPA: carboxypeptidase M32, partial [Candidatus Thermoplasmatota archaeon]|nr:carboxypeptidase M32 [Candidatus Thermoplasmatota archaeon]
MSAYDSLLARLRRMGALRDAAEMLAWDQQVMMPPGGVEARAAQMAALSASIHELLVSAETGRLLAEAEREERDEARRALLREVRFAYDRETRVPGELVEALSKAASRGYEAWVEAKKASDYARFRPHLEELLDLKRGYAAHVDPGVSAYEALFQDYEPWIPLAEARRNLAELRAGLKPLVEKARERRAPRPRALEGSWPAAKQEALSRRVAEMIGYDFQRGRLDTSPHPFSAGGAHDARITTRYYDDDPLPSLLGTIHEAGHATYMQGLPREHAGTPLGEARDLVVHESQSRLWENHVGRSLPFWERVVPMMRETFDGAPRASVQEVWRAVNHVEPTLVRVDADELTYHMHIALRFELEEAMIAGKLPLDELPHRWNEAMERDLGVTPPKDAKGCLQDMHWSTGSFGYFPTYSLGSMLSAQLMAAYPGDADDYGALLAWLREHVHRHGKRYKTGELVERATGRALSPDAFLRYASEKYARVW